MEWDDLRYVLAVARERSLSGAAALLSTSHTTVGRRLRALERSLGARLFDQTPDGFFPTAAGQDLIEVAERTEAELLALEGRILGRDVRLHGALRVATLDLLLRRYQGALASFLLRYPSVSLTLSASDSEVSLVRREADAALRLTNSPPGALVGRKIGQVEFAVFASKALVSRVGAEAPLRDYPWLHWDERLQMHWLDAWLATHAPGASIALRLDVGTLALQEIVAAGVGVHFLSCAEGDADPRLQRLGPVDPAFSRGVWLLTLPELRHNPRVRAFFEHMEAHAPPTV